MSTRLWVGVAALALLGAGCSAVAGPQPPVGGAKSSVIVPKAPVTTTTTLPLDLLSGYGATRAAWAAGHQMDPAGTGYWPRLSSGDDAYTSVTFIGGRALAYTENVYPAMSVADALKVVGDDLPPDAHLGQKDTRPSCEQVLVASRSISALAGVEVLIELHSDGRAYDPSQVDNITYQPFSGSLSALPG
ncbi:MAG: hypothetical protein M3R71_03190, partial [Actinomycetota bacterium]|nr:hypothetical protein [Actinomycetota bacterium]